MEDFSEQESLPSPLHIVNYDICQSSDSDTDDDSQQPTVVPGDNAKTQGPIQSLTVAASPSSQVPQQTTAIDDDATNPNPQASPRADDEQFESSDSEDEEPPPKRPRNSYSLHTKDLPASLVELFKEVKDYFTKPLYLKRQAPPITKQTFDKVYERVCCKYTFIYNNNFI